MQTSFVYNSVVVKDVCTEYWDLTSEKESTGVDQLGVRGQIVLTGIVHAESKGDPAPLPPNLPPPRTKDHSGVMLRNFRGELDTLLKKLSKDRRRFTLYMGGRPIFTVGAGAIEPGVPTFNKETTNIDNMDIDHGPKVSIQVVKITGGVAAHIRFTINFLVPNCGGPATGTRMGDPSGLVNFRFWIHEDINCKTWLTTRTYVGRIRLAHKNINPQRVARLVTVPPLEAGFQRQAIRWDESSDGLGLEFTIQDEEKIAAAPWNKGKGGPGEAFGAIDWDGTLTASTGDNFGMTGTVEFRMRLVGPKTTSKADLIGIGLQVAQSKARFFEATIALAMKKEGFILLKHLSVTESLQENTVEVQCGIAHTGTNIIAGILSLGPEQILGKPLKDLGFDYDPEKHFSPGQTANTGGLFASILQTTCQPTRMPHVIVQPPPEVEVDPLPPKYPTQNDPQQPPKTANSLMSPQQLNSMYMEYLLTSRICSNSGKIALPTGGGLYTNDPYIAIVNLHRPVAMRHIDIDATRVNSFPELPDPTKEFVDANGIRHTLVEVAEFVGEAPQVSADNRKLIFRAQAHLTYAMSRAPTSGESLPLGVVPYRTSLASDPNRVIPASAFIHPDRILR